MSTDNREALSASLEDYLETILQIVETGKVVRASEIGRRMNVSRSSVTGALQALAERKLIHYKPYAAIRLTQEGFKEARAVLKRHQALQGFFERVLAIEEEDADAAACRIEHAIPDEVLERFTQFVKFVESCPLGKERWSRGFSYFLTHGKRDDNCEQCIQIVSSNEGDK